MALETATFINDLVITNPVGTDNRLQGDDHIRLQKSVLKNSFPNMDAPMTATGKAVLIAATAAAARTALGSTATGDAVFIAATSVAARTAMDVPSNADLATKMGNQYLQVQDQKASGTNGGSSVANMNDRTLNTVAHNTMTGASLATNQVTLAAGTYRVIGWTSASAVNAFQSQLFNVTDAAIAIVGSPNYSGATDSMNIQSLIDGRITIAATKVFKLRTYCLSVAANTGLGFPASSGSIEVYSNLTFTRE